MKKHIKTIIVAVTALIMQAAIAAASTGPDLILRSGPGNRHPVKAIIKSSKPIRFDLCNPTWCHIHSGSLAGWVRTKTIAPMAGTFAFNYRNQGQYNTGKPAVSTIKTSRTLGIRLKLTPDPQTKSSGM